MISMWLKMKRRKRGRQETAPTPTLTYSLVVEQLVGGSTVALSALGSLTRCGAGVGEGDPPDEMDDIFAGLRIFIYVYQISNDIHLKSVGIIFLVMCIIEINFYVHLENFIITLTLNPDQNSLCMRTGYLLFMHGSQLVLYVLYRT